MVFSITTICLLGSAPGFVYAADTVILSQKVPYSLVVVENLLVGEACIVIAFYLAHSHECIVKSFTDTDTTNILKEP